VCERRRWERGLGWRDRRSGDRRHGVERLERRRSLRGRRRLRRQWRHDRKHEHGGGSSVLTLTQVNYQFTPAKITVHQGDTITVSDTNPNTPHTFTVTGTDIDVSNDAMSSQDVTIDLAPGTYPFICRFHESQGMTGTLVVK
jgi:plastocyanin